MLALLEPTLAQAEASGLRETLRLLDVPAAWIVVLLILPAFGLVTWIGYARESIGSTTRVVLASLRILAFLLLFVVLSRPVRVQQREEVRPAEVVVLVDDSASMRRKDTYSGSPETRAALQELAGAAPAELSRLELVQRALEGELVPLFERGEYQARLFGFAESATPLAGTSSLTGRGTGTHLGDAVTQVLATHRGRNVTDVVVISDGRSNGGTPVLEAARAAGAAGIPVHTLVVGDTRPEKNAIVELVEAPGEALEGDELAVTVRILGRGATDSGEVQALLEELDEDGNVVRPVYEEEARLTEDGERVVLVAPPVDAGLRTGERRFRVSIPPLSGETMTDDNKVEFSVHVIPARMRVLYVDGYPRWEYRYLKNLLLRSDKNLDVHCFLLSATPDFPQEASRHLSPLRSIPTTREELLSSYDVIILGDVDPSQISHDPSRVDEFLSSVREFVEAGGGLLFQAGEWYNPRRYLTTPLKDVLPVVLDPTGVLAFEGDTQREFRPRLEEPTNPHEILRLHPDAEVNRRLWEDPEEGLRGFYWYAPVDKAKPGAQTLLRHPEHRSQADENYPLLVLGYYPAGRTMFLAIDSTWMWRYHYGDRYHETFWRNAIRWLALGRLKSGDRRFRIETSRATYDLEDRIFLEARVLDEDFRPSRKATRLLHWSGPEGDENELELSLAPGRPGLYRGGLLVDRPGLYRAWMESGGKRVSATEFEVRLPSRETADPSPDPQALELFASKTGGRALDLARSGELADEFGGGEERREPISSRLEDAWDTWTTLLVALGLLSAEWILRKRAELV
jgi:hypothetical protein